MIHVKSILVTMFLLGSVSAFAQQNLNPQHMKCLASSTNYEILTEVNRRMSNGGGGLIDPGQNQGILVVSCNLNQLMVSTTDLQSGQTNEQTFSLGSSSQCNELAAKINELKNSPMTSNKLVGVCNLNQLQKFLIDTSMNIKQLATTSYGSSTQCNTAAAQLNAN